MTLFTVAGPVLIAARLHGHRGLGEGEINVAALRPGSSDKRISSSTITCVFGGRFDIDVKPIE